MNVCSVYVFDGRSPLIVCTRCCCLHSLLSFVVHYFYTLDHTKHTEDDVSIFIKLTIACIKLRPYFLPLLFSYAECVRCPWHFRGCTPGAHSVGSWKPLSILHCAISILLYKACKAVMYSPLGTQGVVMLYRIRSEQTDVRAIGQDH